MTEPPEPGKGPTEALEQLTKLTSSSVEMWSAWTRTWQSLLSERAVPAANSALRMLTDPWSWAGESAEKIKPELEQAFGRARLADVPSPDLDLLRSWQPALKLAQAATAYSGATAALSTQMWQRFQSRLTAAKQEGADTNASGDVLNTWNAVVDEVLLEHNRSEEFAEIQRRFVRAAMRCRIEQQRLTDAAAEACGLPTRAEVDAIHLRLHNLSRRIRALDRAVAALVEGQSPAGEPPQESVLAGEPSARDESLHPQQPAPKRGRSKAR